MAIRGGFFEELGQSPGVVAIITSCGEQALSEARATAPVDSGDYLNAFELEVDTSGNRVVARVRNNDEGAMAIEARHGTLAKAGRSVRG